MTRMKNYALLGCSCLALLTHGAAFAQDSAQQATDTAVAATPAEDIVVTGSRIVRNGNQAPTPVTAVSVEALAATTPSNIFDALQKLPQFVPAGGQRGGAVNGGNPGGSFLDLRGLGANRTLILFDGHRVPPTTRDGTVDISTLPQLLMQRVEVVTGGASAVYGSDAVSGVVNYVLDRKFNGLKVQAQAGISERGDNGSRRLGAAVGTDLFSGRGHFLASAEYYKSDGIPKIVNRPSGAAVYALLGSVPGSTSVAGTAGNPLALFSNVRSTQNGYGGYIIGSAFNGYTFDNGAARRLVQGQATGSSNGQIGGQGPINTGSLLGDLETTQLFGRLDYDLTDGIRAYVQGSFSRAKTFSNFVNVYTVFQSIRGDNAFLPADVAAAVGPNNNFLFSRTNIDTLPFRLATKTDNYFVNAGLEGSLGTFNWDVSYIHGQNKAKRVIVGNLNVARYLAATDAAVAPNGSIVCRATLSNPSLFPGCVPLNILYGPQTNTPQGWDYVRQDTSSVLTTRMDDVAASITGSPFSTWAGPVKVALSGEYRHLSQRNESDVQSGPVDCTGLNRVGCGQILYTVNYLQSVTVNSFAKQSVSEAAIEVDVPVLANLPLVESFNLNGAARYTHYTTSGSVTTWKVGADWHMGGGLRLRGTVSRDIRAPTLNDLFAGNTRSGTGFSDPHTGQNLGTTLQTGGNPNLKPEKAKTFTAGLVYQPRGLPNFSVAVDYYNIKISDAISILSGADANVANLCEQSNGISVYCDLIIRPLPFSDRSTANYPTLLLSQPVNVATTKTHGIDAEINYRFNLAGGQLSLRGLGSYQPKFTTVQFPNELAINNAGVAQRAKLRASVLVGFQTGGFAITTQTRWRSAVKYNGDPRIIFAEDYRVPAAAFTDLSVSQSVNGFGGEAELFLNVSNLFDKAPPVYPGAGATVAIGGTFPALNSDDIVGRAFTVGFRGKF